MDVEPARGFDELEEEVRRDWAFEFEKILSGRDFLMGSDLDAGIEAAVVFQGLRIAPSRDTTAAGQNRSEQHLRRSRL